MAAGASPKTAQINFVVASQSPGPLARNPYAVDAAEMQVGEPIDNLVDGARSWRWRP